MSEAIFWLAYLGAFIATLILGLTYHQRLLLMSLFAAAAASILLAFFTGLDPANKWSLVGLGFNFGMSWFAAAAAVYVVKVVRA